LELKIPQKKVQELLGAYLNQIGLAKQKGVDFKDKLSESAIMQYAYLERLMKVCLDEKHPSGPS